MGPSILGLVSQFFTTQQPCDVYMGYPEWVRGMDKPLWRSIGLPRGYPCGREGKLSNNVAAVLAAAERRRTSRCRVTRAGLLTFSEGAKTFECTIRNLSDTGARIALRTTQLVPRDIHLINVRDRMVYDATIEWRTSTEFGLAFHRACALAELTDPKLTYLKKLWHVRVTR